jgi:hypothetical protein
MSTTADFLDLAGLPDIELLDDLKDLIRHASDNAARSQQTSLGPSEIGHPCARKLAFGLMREPRTNPSGDPLPSIFGTAMHAWLEDAVRTANEFIGRERWLTERKVTVREGLSGTADLFDTDTGTVIDWKCPGTTRMREYKKNGPHETYRAQAHLYGRGYANDGYDVEHVAIAFLPRGGQLVGAHLWREPYDDAHVDTILGRVDSTTVLIEALDVEHHPERYQLIPATPDDCQFCPWWSPNPTLPTHCGGG